LRAQLQTTLGDRYTFEQELGGGGMSRVFVATESALGRSVVIKVLPPDLAAGVSVERFRREIQLAARLQHAHIVPVLASGEIGGLPYFTMPFVRGESLRARLVRDGELPVGEAVRLLREAASALAYAHDSGIVHRDIKPDNVLLSHGDAMVTDFGVAKALEDSATSSNKSLARGVTSLGVALGTPAYMAPEQAAADPSADYRVDIYAFGVLAYELLTGSPPFVGRPAPAVLSAHMTEAPEPINKRRTNLPPALAALVMRCLEKRPADRPQSADELVHTLDSIVTPSGGMQPTSAMPAATVPVPGLGRLHLGWVVAGAVILMLVAGGAFAWRARTVNFASGPTRVAVLPFENLGDSTDAYFADGVSDAVRGKLSALPSLKVIGRTSSTQYRHGSKSPKQIADELGVQYLLTGTVRWEKHAGGQSRVLVSPELLQASDASTKWTQPFDADLSDVFQVQADIASRVAQSLNVALSAGEHKDLADKPTQNLAAYEAFLKGEANSNSIGTSDPAALRRAAAYYTQAVALDSTFFLAWVQLSRTHSRIYVNGIPDPAEAAAARAALEHAMALGPNRPETYLAAGSYDSNVSQDYPKALTQYEHGLRTPPPNIEIMSRAAAAEAALGRWDSALVHMQRAAQLDPRSVGILDNLASLLSSLRRLSEATVVADQALALAPNESHIQARAFLDIQRGDLDAARRVIRAAPKEVDQAALAAFFGNYSDLYWVLDDSQQRLLLSLSPAQFDGSRGTWGGVLAQTYQMRGDLGRARVYADSALAGYLDELKAAPDDAQRHAFVGLMLAILGRKNEAIKEGERSMELMPMSRDQFTFGPYMRHVFARSMVIAGEPDRALDQLEYLLKVPYGLTPAYLKIDPSFAPLKGNPRFEKLLK